MVYEKLKLIIWKIIMLCIVIVAAWGLGQLFAPMLMKTLFL